MDDGFNSLPSWLDAPYINLAFQLLPAGQGDMQQDNPIPCHLEPEVSLVAARLDFPRSSKTGDMPACAMSASTAI